MPHKIRLINQLVRRLPEVNVEIATDFVEGGFRTVRQVVEADDASLLKASKKLTPNRMKELRKQLDTLKEREVALEKTIEARRKTRAEEKIAETEE